jgi:hypothetical protein
MVDKWTRGLMRSEYTSLNSNSLCLSQTQISLLFLLLVLVYMCSGRESEGQEQCACTRGFRTKGCQWQCYLCTDFHLPWTCHCHQELQAWVLPGWGRVWACLQGPTWEHRTGNFGFSKFELALFLLIANCNVVNWHCLFEPTVHVDQCDCE